MFRFDIVPAMRIGCAACASSKPLVAAPPNPVPNSGANRVVAFCVSPPPPRIEPEAAAAAGIALARLLWVRPRSVSDAFRAAEILLGAGGFGLVVLDVDAPRAGAGVWPRLARAAERTRSTLLVVALRRAAGTFAALGLELGARRVRWSGGPGRLRLPQGIRARVTVARSRVGRPGQALVVRQACA